MSERNDQQFLDTLSELNKVITNRAEDATRDRTALRDAVCDYVTVERSRGIALPQIVHAIHSILDTAEWRAGPGPHPTAAREVDLAKRLVMWCLEFRGLGTLPQI